MQCKYVSDQEQFNRLDYWMPPQEFEERKKGDCDDFALWTWRQLMAMGCRCRFVVGRAGRYGDGHAWVTLTKDEVDFIVEPFMASLGETFPRLSTVRYEPRVSVAWDGKQIQYYSHEKRLYNPSVREVLPLVWEWMCFWPRNWPNIIYWRLKRLCRLTITNWRSIPKKSKSV
jgi:Bacterial transglutaminase-like cysteine proteinase BTLCP